MVDHVRCAQVLQWIQIDCPDQCVETFHDVAVAFGEHCCQPPDQFVRAILSLESDTLSNVMDDVKTRNYDTSRRTKRTMATRLRVIEAARDLFLERGYPVTSIEAIAAAADVAPATLYRLFPSKRDLLKAVVDVSAVGDDEPVALHERPELLALRDERDPSAYVRGFAHVARVVGE